MQRENRKSQDLWIRTALVAVLWILFGTMFVTEWKGDSKIWNQVFGVTLMPEPFADLAQIPAAVESVQHGMNPYVKQVYDPAGRAFIYPRVWIYLCSTLRIKPEDSNKAGIVVACCFLLTVSWLMMRQDRLLGSLLIGVAAFSSAGAYAVERGNTDILMLCLVVLAVELRFKGGMWFLVTGAVLKVYPVFALITAALVSRKRILSALALLIGGLAIAAQRSDFTGKQLVNDIPHGYGVKEIDLAMEQTPQRIRQDFAAHRTAFRALWELALIASSATAFAAGARWARSNEVFAAPDGALSSVYERDTYTFLLCASIFAGTFVVTTSYDYRLIFLIPLVPFLLNQSRNAPQRLPRAFAQSALALIVLGVNRGTAKLIPLPPLVSFLKLFSHIDLWALLWIVCFFLGVILMSQRRAGLRGYNAAPFLQVRDRLVEE